MKDEVISFFEARFASPLSSEFSIYRVKVTATRGYLLACKEVDMVQLGRGKSLDFCLG